MNKSKQRVFSALTGVTQSLITDQRLIDCLISSVLSRSQPEVCFFVSPLLHRKTSSSKQLLSMIDRQIKAAQRFIDSGKPFVGSSDRLLSYDQSLARTSIKELKTLKTDIQTLTSLIKGA